MFRSLTSILSLRLCLYVSVYTFCLYISESRTLSESLGLPASVSTPLSLRLCLYVSVSKFLSLIRVSTSSVFTSLSLHFCLCIYVSVSLYKSKLNGHDRYTIKLLIYFICIGTWIIIAVANITACKIWCYTRADHSYTSIFFFTAQTKIFL